MLPVVTPAEMAALDRHTIEAIGVPGVVLMERAALAVADCLTRGVDDRAVAIACGPGNNGADGLALARILHLWGRRVCCWLPTEPAGGDALLEWTAARRVGVPFAGSYSDFVTWLDGATVAVDALFGTGLSRGLTGVWADGVQLLNGCGKPVVAVDIPTGIDGATGRVLGEAVHAAATVTFQYRKLGHCLHPGRALTGRLEVADIGIVDVPALRGPVGVLEEADAALPPRAADSHKGTYGHVAVIAGSRGMLGAGALATRAALRGGAGLVTWLVPDTLLNTACTLNLEAMTMALPDRDGALCADAAPVALEALARRTAAVVGPGLSRGEETIAFVRHILQGSGISMVIDADGLYALAGHPELTAGHDRLVLTPHPGEMARLMDCSVAEVERDPMAVAKAAAHRYGGTVLLKGSTTVVTDGERVALNLTGNPGMATGGSGDVLAGLIGALLAQGLPAYDAACAGCWQHGTAGDRAARALGQAHLIAGDIVGHLP